MEDGESKHLLWDLAVSAAAHLKHLLRREFHTRKIAEGIRLLSEWRLKDEEVCLGPQGVKGIPHSFTRA